MTIKMHKNPISQLIAIRYKHLPFSAKMDAYRQLYQQRTLQVERFAKDLITQRDHRAFSQDVVQSLLWNG